MPAAAHSELYAGIRKHSACFKPVEAAPLRGDEIEEIKTGLRNLVTAGMLRQLKTEEYRERPVTTLADAAYVVGDPLLPPPTEEFPFSSLEGARHTRGDRDPLAGVLHGQAPSRAHRGGPEKQP